MLRECLHHHFDYGCTFWFSALSCKLKSKLQTTQNKLIHFVMGKHNLSHVGITEFKEINWLPVEHSVAQIKMNLVYRIVNSSAPEYLLNDFNHVSQVHRYSTRHHHFVFLLLRVQEKLYLLTQQLSSGMNCLRKLSL